MTINLISVSGQAYVSGNYVNIASTVEDTYDRKGVIVWQEGFEHGFNKWETGGSGTGNSVDVTSAAAWKKDSCCMLTCGSDTNLRSLIQKEFNLFSTGNLGFEFSYASDSYIDYVDIEVVKMGAQHKDAVFRIYKSGVSQYYKADGTWEILESELDFTYKPTHWYTAKMVVNFTENKYVRIIHRDKTFELDAGLRVLPLTYADCIYVTIRAVGGATLPISNAKAYIDNFIITQNEP